MVKYCPNITHLCMHFRPLYCNNEDLLHISRHYHKLKLLCLSENEIEDAVIKEIGHQCTQLTFLDVGGCDLTDQSISQIAHNCISLRYLSIRQTRVSDSVVALILKNCKKLKVLDATNCDEVQNYINEKVCFEGMWESIFNGSEPEWEQVQ